MSALENLLKRCKTKEDVELSIELTQQSLDGAMKARESFKALIKERSEDALVIGYQNKTLAQMLENNQEFIDFNMEYLTRLKEKLSSFDNG